MFSSLIPLNCRCIFMRKRRCWMLGSRIIIFTSAEISTARVRGVAHLFLVAE